MEKDNIKPTYFKNPSKFEELRRIVCIGLLFLFVFQSGSVFLLFRIRELAIQQQVRRQNRRGQGGEEYVVFQFTKTQIEKLYWEKNDEFEFEGVMYDVKQEEQVNDTTFRLTCYADYKETQLHADLNELLFHNRNPKSSELPGLIKKIIRQPWIPATATFFSIRPLVSKTERLTDKKLIYSSPFLQQEDPPPQLLAA